MVATGSTADISDPHLNNQLVSLEIFTAPKNFCDFRPVQKEMSKTCSFFEGDGKNTNTENLKILWTQFWQKFEQIKYGVYTLTNRQNACFFLLLKSASCNKTTFSKPAYWQAYFLFTKYFIYSETNIFSGDGPRFEVPMLFSLCYRTEKVAFTMKF